MSLALLRAVFGSALQCTRCGSPDVHPMQGAYGPLIGLVGLMRYGCRGCRRPFWIRTGAGQHSGSKHGRSEGPPAEEPRTRKRPATLPAQLDFEVTPQRHEKVDLSGLDADFERLRRPPEESKRPDLPRKKKGRRKPSPS